MPRITNALTLLLLVFTVAISQLAPQALAGNHVNISTRLLYVEDECGRLRNNADGTFYPGDALKIMYGIDLGPDTSFLYLEVTYDSGIFTASGSTDISGEWHFELNKETKPGSYVISFTAHGVYTYTYVEGNLTKIASEYVQASSSQVVSVVAYDPRFTALLSYPLFKDSGWDSYEKPFVSLVRYDGNGPLNDTKQRVLIDDYSYTLVGSKSVLNREKCLKSNLTDCSDLVTKSFPDGRVLWWNSTKCGMPLQGDRRYARLVMNMTGNSMRDILQDGYSAIDVGLTFYSKLYALQPKPLFEVSYTYRPEGFKQPIIVKAYKPANGGWSIDSNVRLDLAIKPNGNTTYGEYLLAYASEKTRDDEALKIFQNDFYAMGSQIFEANGSLDALVNRTSLLTYSTMLTVTGYGQAYSSKVASTFMFTGEPVELYVNMVGGGLNIKRIYEGGTYISLDLDIAKEAGGVKWISAYDESGTLMKNFTLPDAATNSMYGATGWFGPYFISIPLSPNSGSQLSLRYGNVWGASSEVRIQSGPYHESSLVFGEELAYLLGVVIFASILIAMITRAVKAS
ncbi:MAG: hypothetical protein HY619_00615 [Thaumarchaeota archaeon]|nr:hypothetical protein [Nitrososphaerota archaeon]